MRLYSERIRRAKAKLQLKIKKKKHFYIYISNKRRAMVYLYSLLDMEEFTVMQDEKKG